MVWNKGKKGLQVAWNKLPDGSKHKKHGYTEIKIRGKWMNEHHYVWLRENDWGMPIIPEGWVVHHKNRKKSDNRIENLVCIPDSTHRAVHAMGKKQYYNRWEQRWLPR